MRRGLVVVCFLMLLGRAGQAQEALETQYVPVEPYIITNFIKKNGKIGFINVTPTLVVKGPEDAAAAEDNMPLVQDYLTSFLGRQPAEVITDVSKIPQLRKEATAGLQKVFQEELGRPVVVDVLFSKFVWQ
jgi:flagellar FliL protein